MKRSSLALLLVASSLSCGPASNPIPVVTIAGSSEGPAIVTSSPSSIAAPAKPISTRIDWLTSEDEARARAKARKLPLVVFFYAAWAVPAARMGREAWADPRITARSSDFVWLWLDVTEADANAQAQADHFDPNTVPSTILLDDRGHEIARLEGFASAEQVLDLLGRGAVPGD